MTEYMGSLDAVSWKTARGWVYKMGGAPVLVDVFSDDEKIGSAVASEFRQDLKNANIGDGRHAFLFEIPEQWRGRKITCRSGDFVIPQQTAETGDEYFRWRLRRKENLLKHIDLSGKGLEFGALHDPLIQGNPNLRYVDHASTEDLIAKYANDTNVIARDLVDVDYVWLDRPLIEVIGDFGPIDYAVALHVGEHVPDLIGWLKQIRAVMKEGGILSLALPDKRYCFDLNRCLSTAGDLLGAHLQELKRPSPVMVLDSFAGAVRRNGEMAWYTWQPQPGNPAIEQVYTLGQAYEIARSAVEKDEYLDAHCWVFTAESFKEIMVSLQSVGLLPFQIVDVHGPDGHEFIATLKAS